MSKKCYMPEVINKVLITGIHWESQEYKGNNHKGEDIIQRNKEKYLGICDICSIEKGKVIATGFDADIPETVEAPAFSGFGAAPAQAEVKAAAKAEEDDFGIYGDIFGRRR